MQNAPGPGGADHDVSEVVRGAIHDFVRSHERRRREPTLDAFDRLCRVPAWASGAIGGAAGGTVGWFVPSALGGGYDLVGQTLAGGIPLATIAGSSSSASP